MNPIIREGMHIFTGFLKRLRNKRYISFGLSRALYPLQRAAGFIDTQIKKKIRVNGADVMYDGIKLRFPADIGVGLCSNIYWLDKKGFEPDTWRVLKILLAQANYFLDVGSNVGFYAVLARLSHPDLAIDAFEPVPSIYDKNRRFHAANGIAAGGLHCAALSDSVTEGRLFLPLSADAGEEETTGTLRQDSWQAQKTNRREISVRTTTLDRFIGSLPRPPSTPLVVKIDVEDYEAAVLRGGREVLKRFRPVIICEILSRLHANHETAQLISDLSYVPFAITQSGCFRFSGDDFSRTRGFNNFLLLPAEGLLASVSYFPIESLGSRIRTA